MNSYHVSSELIAEAAYFAKCSPIGDMFQRSLWFSLLGLAHT